MEPHLEFAGHGLLVFDDQELLLPLGSEERLPAEVNQHQSLEALPVLLD